MPDRTRRTVARYDAVPACATVLGAAPPGVLSPRQLEAEAQVLEVSPLHPHVLLHHISPQTQLNYLRLHVVLGRVQQGRCSRDNMTNLKHVIFWIYNRRHIKEDGIGGPARERITAIPSQLFQSSILIMDFATYRLNQSRGQGSKNHLKCITRWEGRDGVTNYDLFQHTGDEHETSNV